MGVYAENAILRGGCLECCFVSHVPSLLSIQTHGHKINNVRQADSKEAAKRSNTTSPVIIEESKRKSPFKI